MGDSPGAPTFFLTSGLCRPLWSGNVRHWEVLSALVVPPRRTRRQRRGPSLRMVALLGNFSSLKVRAWHRERVRFGARHASADSAAQDSAALKAQQSTRQVIGHASWLCAAV